MTVDIRKLINNFVAAMDVARYRADVLERPGGRPGPCSVFRAPAPGCLPQLAAECESSLAAATSPLSGIRRPALVSSGAIRLSPMR
jgi:hypothetical protein